MKDTANRIILVYLVAILAGGGCSVQSIEDRLATELVALGFEGGTLPPLPEPFGTYEPFVVVDKHIYLTSAAAQRPDGEWVRGIVPTDVSADDAYIASKLSCIHAINRLSHAVDGDLGRIKKLTRVNHMTAATTTFSHLDKIANGCSEMLIRVFGAKVGGHTGTIFAVPSLPWNLTHEVEIVALME